MIVYKVLTYVFGKYFELGILAFLLFYIAAKTTPEEYSILTPLLLVISYSTLLYSGLGASYVKKVALGNDESKRRAFSEYLTLSLLLAIVFSTSVFFLLKDTSLTWFIVCLTFLNSMRSFGQSYFRAKLSEKLLVKFNLIYPLIALFSFVFISNNLVESYVESYVYSQTLGMLVSVVLLFIYFKSTEGKETEIVIVRPSKSFFIESLKLFFVNFVSFTFLMIDKIVVLNYMADDFIGQYQLYENFSNIFHLGLASTLYLLTPYLLTKYNSVSGFDKNGKFQLSYLLFIVLLGFVFYLIAQQIVIQFYSNYADNLNFIAFQILIKVTALSVFLPSVYYSYKHKEKKYIISALVSLLVVIIGLITFDLLGVSRSIEFALFCILGPFICFSLFVNINLYSWNKLSGT